LGGSQKHLADKEGKICSFLDLDEVACAEFFSYLPRAKIIKTTI